MSRYPVLEKSVPLMKLVSVIVGGCVMFVGGLLGVLNESPFLLFVSILGGALVTMLVWASAEFVQMMLDGMKMLGNIKETNQLSKNAIVRMYVDSKRDD